MIELNSLNTGKISEIKKGSVLVIQRKCDDPSKKYLVKVREVIGSGDEIEILLSKIKNDYFNWNMYRDGKSWVWRVWVLDGAINITSITNNINEFPR